MELVAGTVAASPCPPLPLLINRSDTKTGKDVPGFASSHHILMEAMTHAMARDSPKENKIRQIRQTELTNILPAEFCNKLNTPQNLYDACTSFTRNYLHCFLPKRSVPDARFANYADIACDTYNSNKMIASCAEHLAGLMFYDEDGKKEYDDCLEPLKNMPFSQILQEYANVHVNRSLEIPSIMEVDE